MGLIADVRRSIALARMLEYPCPGCQRVIPRDSVRFHSRRGFCPHCGGIILAPPGEPTGLVGVPPPPEDEHSDQYTLLARLGFLPAAFAGSLVLYLFWMLPGILRAAAVGYFGWRPIGGESTAVTIVGLAITFIVALFALSLAILGTRRMPGTFGTAASIHESPLGPRPSHATLWPIPDCPGARRPEVPWYIEPYTGPR